MFTKFKFLNYRVMIYARRVYNTGGVNSTLEDSKHVPMFDLDHMNIREAETEALNIQEEFKLGDAVLINTGRPDSFHIYFMNRVEWRKAIKIGVSCYAVDLKHIQFSLKRGHFTLRLLSKNARKLTLVSVIRSKYLSDFTPKDFYSFVLYETASIT